MVRWLIGMLAACAVMSSARAAEPETIGIGYLGHAGLKATLSFVELPSDDNGIAGARLAIADNNTTGTFLN
ncbi:MAG: branched-chain amino acid ABC transporter substrate-binding protein, partial [Hyphomicrobiales bacterium]|nr:branched-chain amino acid ABC transporter substrate-binding protein [Hyphomicrobiales bacterium]